MKENKRDDFCKWYYAQPQPLAAHEVFDWFISESMQPETTISHNKSRTKKVPHKCPVCGGTGIVPSSFYTYGINTTFSNTTELCRSCTGTGVILV